MSKVMLVMDKPNVCIDCPVHFAGISGQVWCGKEKKRLLSDDIEIFKPDWCPLKDVSDKYWPVSTNFERGWNACIDELLKEII